MNSNGYDSAVIAYHIEYIENKFEVEIYNHYPAQGGGFASLDTYYVHTRGAELYATFGFASFI